MNDFLFSLRSVLPVLALLVTGWFCRKKGLLTESLVRDVNQLVFRVFLPVSLCYSILKTPTDTVLSGKAFALITVGLLCEFGLLFLIVPRIEKDRKKIGVLIQAMGRANYAYFGIPLVAMLFPGQDTSLASLLVIGTVPIYNVMSVIALSVYGEGEIRPGRIVWNILKNPLIIGSLLGYALWLLRLFPFESLYAMEKAGQTAGEGALLSPFAYYAMKVLDTVLADLSKVATPLALFTLGGAIQFRSVKGHRKQLGYAVPFRLLLSPAIFLLISAALGLRDVALACVFVAFGAPTAVSSFPMAQQMGGDGDLAAELVAVTTTLSVITTFLFIFAMKSMGLI